MFRTLLLAALIAVGTPCFLGMHRPLMAEESIRGKYVEARTCQVYTGPCFAGGEVGSVGKDAIMIWKAEQGSIEGVDLSGHSVAVVVKTSHTLGFNGFDDAESTRALLVVDESADERQTAALKRFALNQTGIGEDSVVALKRAAIDMQFDTGQLTASVQVGELAHLVTRKARKGDCICSNESAYYPPLNKLQGFVPGVTLEGEVSARPLGSRWSIPDSRTAYLGLFDVEVPKARLAAKL